MTLLQRQPIRSPWRVPLACAGLAAAALAAVPCRAIDLTYLDRSTSPCSDFYQYANGGWMRTTPIPPDRDSWGLDEELEQRNLAILRRIVDDAAAHPGEPGSPSQLIGDFHAAAMDEAAIERAGTTPLRGELDEVAALKTAQDVAALIRAWHVRGLDPLFELQAQEDLADSDTMIAYAGQGGLGLPDRGYYMRSDTRSALLRVRYRKHVARMLGLLGERDADAAAAQVLALETRLARASLDPLALRAPENSWHPMTPAEGDATTPHFSWTALFAASGRGDVKRFSLAQPGFFAAADRALVEEPVGAWQAYLRWHLIDDAAPYLGKAFAAANFDFRGHALRGLTADKPRWKRAVSASDALLGDALGQAYVAEVLPPQARARALELVGNLKIAMRARLANLSWMGESTRQAALAKLDALGAKIGYPDRWRDYSQLAISREVSWYANIRAALAFEARRQFAKFDRPVDRGEWDMTPQTVNAYNNPMRNEIVFPAAQLLPPYFDAQADDAVNYGAIGAVIGHEILHAFDDQGSKFDARGNLADWWTPQDRAQFDARTAALVDQFDAYVAIDELHVDGRLTLGENIADLGGLLLAWDAFQATAQAHGDDTIDGLSAGQRFFIAYAQSWRERQRRGQVRRQVQSNEHAPARLRVDGPLANLPAFAQAFACGAGTPMAGHGAQVKIW
jgi:putative endopeptidase